MSASFRGILAPLSNLHPAPIALTLPGDTVRYTFPSVEHAFQAAKQPARAAEFTVQVPIPLCGADAKRLGRTLELRPDWESVKVEVMKHAVWAKFTQHPDLITALLMAPTVIQEVNTWGDTFWGVNPQGVGQNHLGVILMQTRVHLLRQRLGQYETALDQIMA